MVSRFQQRLEKILFPQEENHGPFGRFSRYFLRLGFYLIRQLQNDLCVVRAAALAYSTIFSLVPALTLFVVYIKMTGALDTFSVNVQDWIVRTFVAEQAQGVAEHLDRFIGNMSARNLGIFGFTFLFILTYFLLSKIESSFNAIWDVRKNRNPLLRLQLMGTLLFFLPILLAGSFYISGKFDSLVKGSEQVSFLRSFFLVLGPYLLTSFAMFFLFKFVPNTFVATRPALISGFVVAILLELAKHGFNLYVIHVVSVEKIYGSLGLIPVFLLWIFLCWLIVFFGVELSYTIQNLSVLHEDAESRLSSNPLRTSLHEKWALRIFREFRDIFQSKGGPVSLDLIAERLPLPKNKIHDHLQVLVEEKLLQWVDDDNRNGFLPLKPVDKISDAVIESLFLSRLGL